MSRVLYNSKPSDFVSNMFVCYLIRIQALSVVNYIKILYYHVSFWVSPLFLSLSASNFNLWTKQNIFILRECQGLPLRSQLNVVTFGALFHTKKIVLYWAFWWNVTFGKWRYRYSPKMLHQKVNQQNLPGCDETPPDSYIQAMYISTMNMIEYINIIEWRDVKSNPDRCTHIADYRVQVEQILPLKGDN